MIRPIIAVALALAASRALAAPAPLPVDARFASEINGFAIADQVSPPQPCQILFVGSSSIRFWKTLAADMLPYAAINRGFGGSEISDVDAYFDRVVAPYHPRAIVFYAGDNDIHDGKSPQQAFGDFETFLRLKDTALGATRVYFISTKPSKARFAEFGRQRELNDLVKDLSARRKDLAYIDVVPDMLEGGQPKDIFVADGLHMDGAGYAIWTRDVKAVLDRTGASKLSCR